MTCEQHFSFTHSYNSDSFKCVRSYLEYLSVNENTLYMLFVIMTYRYIHMYIIQNIVVLYEKYLQK